MLTTNKFSSDVLKKLEKASFISFELAKKQIEKMLIGSQVNLVSRMTCYKLHDQLGMTEQEVVKFTTQFIEKLRRHSMNIIEQIEIRRK
jgi:hypothetical protein